MGDPYKRCNQCNACNECNSNEDGLDDIYRRTTRSMNIVVRTRNQPKSNQQLTTNHRCSFSDVDEETKDNYDRRNFVDNTYSENNNEANRCANIGGPRRGCNEGRRSRYAPGCANDGRNSLDKITTGFHDMDLDSPNVQGSGEAHSTPDMRYSQFDGIVGNAYRNAQYTGVVCEGCIRNGKEYLAEPEVSLSKLPDEILLQVFRRMDCATLVTCATVNTRWNGLSSDDTVWRPRLTLDTPALTTPGSALDLEYEAHALAPQPVHLWKALYAVLYKRKRDSARALRASRYLYDTPTSAAQASGRRVPQLSAAAISAVHARVNARVCWRCLSDRSPLVQIPMHFWEQHTPAKAIEIIQSLPDGQLAPHAQFCIHNTHNRNRHSTSIHHHSNHSHTSNHTHQQGNSIFALDTPVYTGVNRNVVGGLHHTPGHSIGTRNDTHSQADMYHQRHHSMITAMKSNSGMHIQDSTRRATSDEHLQHMYPGSSSSGYSRAYNRAHSYSRKYSASMGEYGMAGYGSGSVDVNRRFQQSCSFQAYSMIEKIRGNTNSNQTSLPHGRTTCRANCYTRECECKTFASLHFF